MKNIDEFIKGCEHYGSFVPVNEVKRLMQAYADHILNEKMKEFAEWVDENYGEEAGTFIQDILKKYLKQ